VRSSICTGLHQSRIFHVTRRSREARLHVEDRPRLAYTSPRLPRCARRQGATAGDAGVLGGGGEAGARSFDSPQENPRRIAELRRLEAVQLGQRQPSRASPVRRAGASRSSSYTNAGQSSLHARPPPSPRARAMLRTSSFANRFVTPRSRRAPSGRRSAAIPLVEATRRFIKKLPPRSSSRASSRRSTSARGLASPSVRRCGRSPPLGMRSSRLTRGGPSPRSARARPLDASVNEQESISSGRRDRRSSGAPPLARLRWVRLPAAEPADVASGPRGAHLAESSRRPYEEVRSFHRPVRWTERGQLTLHSSGRVVADSLRGAGASSSALPRRRRSDSVGFRFSRIKALPADRVKFGPQKPVPNSCPCPLSP